ncbi:MAG TPA: ribosome maturation factor RimM [Acidimicrobiia bacterium]|nr:ribosome maturation factor RimM [Acidimicrobiia bacterium]
MSPEHPGEGSGLLEVGRILRPHGLSGEVLVELWSDQSRLRPGNVLDTERGPLTVTASRHHRDRFLVSFSGVTDRAAADAWRGVALLAEPLSQPGTLWVHQLVGATVVSATGEELGVVEAVEPNPASDLLVLGGGGLVPLRFVVSFEPHERVVVDIPDGLLD